MTRGDILLPQELVDAALTRAATSLGVRLVGPRRYGWRGKSAGSRACDLQKCIHWIHVRFGELHSDADQLIVGTTTAAVIQGVHKPHLLGSIDWLDDTRRWHGDLTTLVAFETISVTPQLTTPVQLSDRWFASLRGSLSALQTQTTTRTCVRDDLITRRLRERFDSSLNPNISQWVTSHGDLHWANLTHPECWILDWEAWGLAPYGFDAAVLLCFSLLEPEMTRRVEDVFRDALWCKDGMVMQLFVCAELLRMAELYRDHLELVEPLMQRSRAVYNAL